MLMLLIIKRWHWTANFKDNTNVQLVDQSEAIFISTISLSYVTH